VETTSLVCLPAPVAFTGPGRGHGRPRVTSSVSPVARRRAPEWRAQAQQAAAEAAAAAKTAARRLRSPPGAAPRRLRRLCWLLRAWRRAP
jgi:hypothetical protein